MKFYKRVLFEDIRISDEVPEHIHKLMKDDPEIGSYTSDKSDYRGIYHNDEPIGSMCYHKDSSGYIKIRSIFITPEHRGKGYASKAVEKAIGDSPAYTFISDYNKSSKKMFSKIGFNFSKMRNIGGENLEMWTKE